MNKRNRVISNNKFVESLYKSDQRDRRPAYYLNNAQVVALRDKKRRLALKEIISNGSLITANDFYHAAVIYQHGFSIRDYALAVKLSKISIEKGGVRAKWLYAAATDRLLVSKNRKQKFGTQFIPKTKYVKPGVGSIYFVVAPYDLRTTDELRKKFDVPALSELAILASRIPRRAINLKSKN